MEKPDPDSPKLTKNDQKVLKKIIEHAKMPDAEIAKDMGITPQAVFKIRNKLEDKGIIKGYQPVLDFKNIGIKAMAMLIVRLTSAVWEKHTDEEVTEKIRKVPNVINAYRILDSEATHILLMGFRDIETLDRHLAKLQTKFSREIEIKKIYPFAVDKVIAQSPIGLLQEVIDDRDGLKSEFFLSR